MRIHVGEDEILLNDPLRFGVRMRREGGTIQVDSWEGMIHVFSSNLALLRAARKALVDIGVFLRQQTNVRRPRKKERDDS